MQTFYKYTLRNLLSLVIDSNYICHMKHFEILLALLGDPIIMIILVKFKINPKICMEITRYLVQVCIYVYWETETTEEITKVFSQLSIILINLNFQWIIFNTYHMLKTTYTTLYTTFLLNIYLLQISCSFYTHFQINFKFDQYNRDSCVRVSLHW